MKTFYAYIQKCAYICICSFYVKYGCGMGMSLYQFYFVQITGVSMHAIHTICKQYINASTSIFELFLLQNYLQDSSSSFIEEEKIF